MANQFINLPAPSGNGVGTAVDLSSCGALKTFIIDGTWRLNPTITIEMNDDAAAAGSWVPVTRSFQGRGQERVEIVGRWFRVRVENHREGPDPAVNVGTNDNGTTLFDLPVTVGTGVGAAVATTNAGAFKTFCVQSGTVPFRGAVIIEVSTDGATEWSQVAVFDKPGFQNFVLTSNFVRARRAGVPANRPGLPIVTMGAENPATASGGGGVAVSASASSMSSGTVTFSNANNVSFGLSNGVMTASASGGAGGVAISGGASSQSNGTVIFANANNVSFGLSAGTMTASIAAVESVSAGSTFATGPQIVFANGNGVTFGVNGNTITGSISQTLQPSAAVSAGTNIATSGTASFINSNGFTFGMNTSNGITAQFPAVQRFNLVSAGTQTAQMMSGNGVAGTAYSGTFHFTNGNGISFGLSTTNVGPVYSLSASHDGIRSISGSNGAVGGSLVQFGNANGVSFGVAGSTITASVSQIPFGLSAGTQSVSTGTVVFASSNGITFGMSGSSQITADYAGIRSVVAGAATYTNGGVTFVNGASGISFATVGVGSIIGIQGARYGVSTAGNTAGSTGTFFAQMLLVGVGGVTLSQSTNAGLQGTVSIVAPPGISVRQFADPAMFGAQHPMMNGGLSLYRNSFGANATLTQFRNMFGFSYNTVGVTETVTVSYGLYTFTGSTASLASSHSATFTIDQNVLFGSSPGMFVGTGSTFNVTPGDYLVAHHVRWGTDINASSGTYYGANTGSASIGIGRMYGGDATVSQQFVNGYSNASFSTAMPASINLTNANYVRTGSAAGAQPSFQYLGA